ncbi:serine hydrolase [Paenibacillus sp. NEAU-GSW1]|uniref:serine hydrolase n=1 Tax=Paenibacillus sp. NEAU-GSW1 TaxID=2682486 RepID=UPI0020A671C1|nr:serine hydrolase [Paenibacillus sp. NEAU-GSW1]
MLVKKAGVAWTAAVIAVCCATGVGGLGLEPIAAAPTEQAAARSKAIVTINGGAVHWNGEPFVEKGATMVPLREAAVSLGGKVAWNQGSQTVSIALNGDVVTQRSGDSLIRINGVKLQMSGPSRTIKGSLMVPLRGLMEAMRASLNLSQTPAGLSIAIATDKSTQVNASAAAIDSYLQQNSFSGMALVAKDGKALLRKGYGLANDGKLNRPDGKTRIASITKSFTAASIMQLVEAGKLKLNDPISTVVTGIPGGERITIHMLLSHTSGLPSEFTRQDGVTLEQTIDEIRGKTLAFEPGTDYKYSNCGYVLLAYTIEKLSGMSYGDYVEKRLLNAAGMKQSGTATVATPTNQGYVLAKDGSWTKAPYYASQSGTGTLYSTVDDLLKWDGLLRSGKLLTEQSLQAMYTAHSAKGYGYGWIVKQAAEGKIVFHNGSGSGYSTGMSRNLDNGVTVILLSNHAGADTAMMMDKLQSMAAAAILQN